MLITIANLTNKRIEIKEALHGQAAIDVVKKSANPFDLIIMDLHMPVLNGFEVFLSYYIINYLGNSKIKRG